MFGYESPTGELDYLFRRAFCNSDIQCRWAVVSGGGIAEGKSSMGV
jgi:hypothetical protein